MVILWWSHADGLVAYFIPQGDRQGGGVELLDYTYDGNLTEDGRLCGGLGQLVDGEEGQSNFRLDPLERGVRGYEWIGWKNDSFSSEQPLQLVFRWATSGFFDRFSSLSSVTCMINNESRGGLANYADLSHEQWRNSGAPANNSCK